MKIMIKNKPILTVSGMCDNIKMIALMDADNNHLVSFEHISPELY